MKPEEILKILFSDDNGYFAEFKNTDDVVMGCADIVTEHLQIGDQTPLSVLFSIIVHVLARETSGGFEKQFIRNVTEQSAIYREHYAKALKQHPELELTTIMTSKSRKLS